MIKLEKGIYPFWDDHLIDTRFSDAELSVNRMVKRDVVMTFDKPWEGNGVGFCSIFRDGDIYRMYYHSWSFAIEGAYNKDLCHQFPPEIRVCYAYSHDGIHWERPNLGICEFDGSTDNNIIMENVPDNFSIMIDRNPDCPPEMKYKALMLSTNDLGSDVVHELYLFVSGDGLHFEKHSTISKGYIYDTLNTLHWDEYSKKYYCYIRDRHDAEVENDERFNEKTIRAIRVFESADCVNWTEPVPLNFDGSEDYPLYTNNVMLYPFDTRYQVGFPMRYVERKGWTSNYEQLPGKTLRLERMKLSPRLGLSMSDCAFMSSRDHYNWYRFDEALVTSGLENDLNWGYGECVAQAGEVLVLPSRFPHEPDELALYFPEGHWAGTPKRLILYTVRQEGFASVKAPYRGRTLKTKPFTFEGGTLSLNFRSSARGGIVLHVLDELGHQIPGYTSCEIFGDSVHRVVEFEKPLSDLCGRTVVFQFSMRDAELYSMTFAE